MPTSTLWGLGAGVVLSVVYAIAYMLRHRATPELSDAAEITFSCLAGGSAVKLFLIAVATRPIAGLEGEDRGYIGFGAFAVMWIAIVTGARVFGRLR